MQVFFTHSLREYAHKNVFVSGWTTKGGGVKPPGPLKKNCMKNKMTESHETQEKLIKKCCMLCSVLVNIDQQKNVIDIFAKYPKIIF